MNLNAKNNGNFIIYVDNLVLFLWDTFQRLIFFKSDVRSLSRMVASVLFSYRNTDISKNLWAPKPSEKSLKGICEVTTL